MSTELCKGGCRRKATFKQWCDIKWQVGKKYAVSCPVIEKKRGKSISRFRIAQARRGENPMQNPEICAKNNSPERIRKVSEKLKEKGKLGLLPQQTESKKLKEKRRKRICAALRTLTEKGMHPRQKETAEQRKKRMENVSRSLTEKIKAGLVSPSYGKVKPGKYKGVMFRSQWEIKTAKFLNRYGFYWEYETLSVEYYDTETQRTRHTVPDFYLPAMNTVIEVKGRWLDAQRTQDKLNGIRAQGAFTILIGEKEMELMKKYPYQVIQLIESAEL